MSENASSGRKSWWTWIRVSEVVGVIAVIIAILNFWDSHQERKATDQARQAADQRAAIAPAFVLVAAADANGERIRLTPVHADQPIQSQQFIFPTEIRAQPVETAGSARIEASWFEEGLRKAAGKGAVTRAIAACLLGSPPPIWPTATPASTRPSMTSAIGWSRACCVRTGWCWWGSASRIATCAAI